MSLLSGATAAGTRVERHGLDALPPGMAAEWADLVERSIDPNPYTGPGLVVAAARHLLSPGSVSLVTVRDPDGTMQVCLPVRARPFWRALPWPALTTRVHLYSLAGAPPVGRHAEGDSLARALTCLPDRRLVVFEWVREDSPLVPVIREAAARSGRRLVVWERFRRSGWSPPPGEAPGVSGHRRRRLARARRELAAATGGEVRMVDRSGQPGALERFLRLEAAGWKGRAGTALLRRPGHAGFLRDIPGLRLAALEAGGHPVAMVSGFSAGGQRFLFKIGWDPAYSRFSPGHLLIWELTRSGGWGDGPVDSCSASSDGWASSLLPGELPFTTLVLAPAGVTAAAVAAAAGANRGVFGGEGAAGRGERIRPWFHPSLRWPDATRR